MITLSKVTISLSAGTHGFKKGNRVVVKVGRGAWHIGTIKTAGAKLKIVFDDEMEATVEEEDFPHVFSIPEDTPTNADVLTTPQAKALYSKPKDQGVDIKSKTGKKAKGGALKRLIPNRPGFGTTPTKP